MLADLLDLLFERSSLLKVCGGLFAEAVLSTEDSLPELTYFFPERLGSRRLLRYGERFSRGVDQQDDSLFNRVDGG